MSRPTCRCKSENVHCSPDYCDLAPTGVPYDGAKHCRLCWLYFNDSKYHPLWSSEKTEEIVLLDIGRLMGNYILAMGTEASWRAGGGQPPSLEEKAKRRAACDVCPLWDPTWDACTRCGCYLEAGIFPPRPLGKLDCATQACPIGIWGYTGGFDPSNGGCSQCGGEIPQATTSFLVKEEVF